MSNELKPTDKIILTVRDFETKYISRQWYDELLHRAAALEAEIASMRAEARWIPVGERLPEIEEGRDFSGAVLTLSEGRVANKRRLCVTGRWYEMNGELTIWTITHWRPLPPPPEEKGREEG